MWPHFSIIQDKPSCLQAVNYLCAASIDSLRPNRTIIWLKKLPAIIESPLWRFKRIVGLKIERKKYSKQKRKDFETKSFSFPFLSKSKYCNSLDEDPHRFYSNPHDAHFVGYLTQRLLVSTSKCNPIIWKVKIIIHCSEMGENMQNV